jgi:GrpB-like predicted nucleotidyltransferase (UPF0157 family)
MVVTLVTRHNPEWVAWFLNLHAFLGRNLAGTYHAIEHVGSTAVPGMTAKPIIDIDVVLREGAFERVKGYLEGIGYRYEGDKGIPGRETFDMADYGLRQILPPHHLYVLYEDAAELQHHRAFRDYLRSHPEDAARLSDLKWSLAERLGTDREAYQEAKAPLVREILERALQQAPA